MIDEYQDSNYLQEKIIFMLREKNRNLAVVGDDYQCIYGFRGSMVENIINFPQKMSGCKVVYLTQNYRSNQEIMDLSNIVMKKHSLEACRNSCGQYSAIASSIRGRGRRSFLYFK